MASATTETTARGGSWLIEETAPAPSANGLGDHRGRIAFVAGSIIGRQRKVVGGTVRQAGHGTRQHVAGVNHKNEAGRRGPVVDPVALQILLAIGVPGQGHLPGKGQDGPAQQNAAHHHEPATAFERDWMHGVVGLRKRRLRA